MMQLIIYERLTEKCSPPLRPPGRQASSFWIIEELSDPLRLGLLYGMIRCIDSNETALLD